MEKTDKQAWGQWLQGVLTDTLAGSGLRPEVEYLEPARYRVTIVCPLEWKVTNWLPAETITLEKVQEIVDAVLEFYREAWPERMCTDYMYDIWRRVPGFFDWLTEQAPVILYRVTMQQLTQHYGPRAVKGITMYDDLLVVHARRAGNFYIDIDNYRRRLDDVVKAMRAFMRKPLRFQYLYQLRNGKNNKK